VELSGVEGEVIGVDLVPCIPIEGAKLLVGDITDIVIQESVVRELAQRPLNVVVSDISPDITGNWSTDQAVSIDLVAKVLDFSLPLLCAGGSFVTKVFQGTGIDELIAVLKEHFSKVRRFSPEASRNASSEVYIVCRNHQPWRTPNISLTKRWEESMSRLDGNESGEDVEPSTVGFRVLKRTEAD
jgi:23S rRNA (uridine2552-2'-O)-methyltransferase